MKAMRAALALVVACCCYSAVVAAAEPDECAAAPPTNYTLEWLLHPFDTQHYLDEYWERAPLLVRRRDPAYYRRAKLFSMEDVAAVVDALLPIKRMRPSDDCPSRFCRTRFVD